MKTLSLKIKTVFLLASFAIFTATAQTATSWNIDKPHTSVNFSVNHFITAVNGSFTDFDGEIHFSASDLANSKAEFVVLVSSVETGNNKRNNHLQSNDFFNAKAFPEMKFSSTKFEQISEMEYSISGNLTIKDKTHPIILKMKVTGEMMHPMKKNTKILGVSFTTTIDRTDYGVGTGDWAATMVVGDEVTISIPMELNSKN